MSETSEAAKNPNPAAKYLTIGWICVLIAVVVLLLPYRLFYISVPLCVVAIVLAFKGLKKGGGKPAAALMWSAILIPAAASLAGLVFEVGIGLFK